MKMKPWIDWVAVLVLWLWAAAPTRSAAQGTLVVNVGIYPPISTNFVGSSITLSATQDTQGLLNNDFARGLGTWTNKVLNHADGFSLDWSGTGNASGVPGEVGGLISRTN